MRSCDTRPYCTREGHPRQPMTHATVTAVATAPWYCCEQINAHDKHSSTCSFCDCDSVGGRLLLGPTRSSCTSHLTRTHVVLGLLHIQRQSSSSALERAVLLQVHLRYLENQNIDTALCMHLTITIVWAQRLARLRKLYRRNPWQS